MKRTILRLVVLCVLLPVMVILAMITHRRLTAAPVRYLDAPGWMQRDGKRASVLPLDDSVRALIRKAEGDYRIAPIPKWRGKLIFSSAAAVDPNDVYLIFGIEGQADNAIVYRFSREDSRPLWKALWVQGG